LAINVVKQVSNKEFGLFGRFYKALIFCAFVVGLPIKEVASPCSSSGDRRDEGGLVGSCSEGEEFDGSQAAEAIRFTFLITI